MYIFAQKCLCIENDLYLCTAKMVECATVFAVGLVKTDRNGYSKNTQKYYSMDIGLRNAKLNGRSSESHHARMFGRVVTDEGGANFRQQEKSHLMENMIFVELIRRGYSVDVGVVELTIVKDGKKQQSQYEIDFIVNTGREKVYIQSALNVDTEAKKSQETFSLKNSGDFFRKIVIVDGNAKPWTDEDGIIYVGVIPFLLGGVAIL